MSFVSVDSNHVGPVNKVEPIKPSVGVAVRGELAHVESRTRGEEDEQNAHSGQDRVIHCGPISNRQAEATAKDASQQRAQAGQSDDGNRDNFRIPTIKIADDNRDVAADRDPKDRTNNRSLGANSRIVSEKDRDNKKSRQREKNHSSSRISDCGNASDAKRKKPKGQKEHHPEHDDPRGPDTGRKMCF